MSQSGGENDYITERPDSIFESGLKNLPYNLIDKFVELALGAFEVDAGRVTFTYNIIVSFRFLQKQYGLIVKLASCPAVEAYPRFFKPQGIAIRKTADVDMAARAPLCLVEVV